MRDRAVVRARVEGITKILTIPTIVGRITTMVSSGTVSAGEIADEIGKDQILAAKVLKLVNSGFYGFRQPISTSRTPWCCSATTWRRRWSSPRRCSTS